ncbi:MAG: PAS domain-containing sensor histidine kinase [Myxococcota bacterium]
MREKDGSRVENTLPGAGWKGPLLDKSLWLTGSIGLIWVAVVLVTEPSLRGTVALLALLSLSLSWLMAFARQLPQSVRVLGLLGTHYSCAALTLAIVGPFAPAVLALLVLFLLFATLYFARRGTLLGATAIAVLYALAAVGWTSGKLPVMPPGPAFMNLRGGHIWLRVGFGQLLVSISVSAVVMSVLRRAQHATESLQASEQKFERAFRASPHAIAITEIDSGRFVDVNDGFERLFGWRRAEIIGATSVDIGMWAHASERARLAAEVLKQGSAHDVASTLRTRDGRDLPCLFSAETVDLGDRRCFVATIRDISERLNAERALRESEEKFSKAFHASAEAISITSAKTGAFVDVNRGYEVLIGHTRAEVVGRTAIEVGMWADPASRAPMMEKMQREGTLRDYPIIVKNKAGEALDILFSADFIELSGERHIVAVARDVTKQRRAELAVKQSEERFRLLVEHAPDAIVVFDVETNRFTAANPAAEQLFGRSEAELKQCGPVDVSPERQADGRLSAEAAPIYLRAAISGERPRFDWLHQRADGSDVPCEVRLLRLPDPKRVLVRGSMLDVSEQRRAERAAELLRAQSEAAIRKLNAELEQRVADRTAQLTSANAELEAFSYSVSHDLRSPLRAIDGFSRALEEDYGSKLDPEASDYLRRVRAAVQRMGELIDDLLQLSRATRSELRRERIDLSEVASEIERELRDRYAGRDVSFTHAPGLLVQADRTLSRILLENLLDNAWKYSKGRESAVIELGKLPQSDEQGASVFFVRDNGAGFDMRYASKLFTPFQRLHTKGEFEGTGIGLATVRRIAGRHGGKTWAESVVGQGTIVYFTLSGATE